MRIQYTQSTSPVFVIKVDRKRIDLTLLLDTLASLRDTYCSVHAGIGTKNGQRCEFYYLGLEFSNPNYTYTDNAYRVGDLVCYLQKLGFDVFEKDVSISYRHTCPKQAISQKRSGTKITAMSPKKGKQPNTIIRKETLHYEK